MTKVKNVRPGILIIPDSKLKLSPGETVELSDISAQAQRAIDDGLLTRVDKEQEAKPKAKAASRDPESKEPDKTEATGTEAEQTSVPNGDTDKVVEQSEAGKRRDVKQKPVVEAESGDQ